jgi:hypothetical protein
MFVIAINLLKTYWKPLVGFLLVAAIWGHGNMTGKSAIRSQWKEEKLQMAMAIQAEKDRLQDEANQKSKELEKSLSDMRVKNQTLNRKLANEIRKNDVAYRCPVPTIGMQSFNDSITPNNSTR